MANVPTLRFPGFTDKWETSRLSSYLIENKERNRNNEFGKDKVLSVSGEEGIVNQIEHLGRSFAGKSVSDYHVVRHGNIVYTKSPLKEYPYGIVKYNRGVDGIVSTLYAVYESKDSSYGPFVEYYFALATRVNRYFKPIVRIGAKHDMKIGNEEVLQNTVIFPNIEEQKKIADFLSLLDERIALQSKLIDRLKSLMDGIVVKHWKGVEKGKFCLSDLGEAFSVMNLSKDDLTEDGKYCIIYGELFTTYDAIIDNVVSHTDKVDRLTLSGDNDLLFPASTTVNAYSLISPSAIIKRDVVLGGDMFGIHISSEHSAEYISLIINAIYRNKLSKYAKGSTIIHLHYGDIKNVQIELPELEMQLYLVGVVKRLRAKLSIETDYLTALNNVKQSLLSAMFI